MITSVDTNVLLALLYEDEHADESEAELRRVYREGRIVATLIVYAELAADGYFESASELDRFREDFSIQLVEHRQHIAEDFVSFDNAFYETYFPSLTVYPE